MFAYQSVGFQLSLDRLSKQTHFLINFEMEYQLVRVDKIIVSRIVNREQSKFTAIDT